MKTLSRILLGVSVLLLSSFVQETQESKPYPKLKAYIEAIPKDFDKIPQERKDQLKKVTLFLKSKLSAEQKASLVFICTHNSRRSHMAQIWAQTAADYYGIKGVSCFSGGTEATAFNPRAVKALTNAGFKITPLSEDKNPVYEVKYADDAQSIKAFSKKYSDDPNPKSNFCAVMTCSQADKTCPTVEGSTLRVAIPFEDPKAFDGTPEEEAKYDERCKQIATEMFYIFSLYSK
ncbi:MAG: protein-tyrosine-phosphatase [Bacteroidota bacterium]|nr:protein-tyrosine-phosphatase [Bacteroidota bacterium]